MLNGELARENIMLASPNFTWHDYKETVIKKFVSDDIDFFRYDTYCLTLLAYIFLVPNSVWQDVFTQCQSQEDIRLLIKTASDQQVTPIILDML